MNNNLEDNFPAYIFHGEYAVDPSKAEAIHIVLARNNFTTDYRLFVLSNYSANYTRYHPYADNAYADDLTLDGIYYSKTGNFSLAQEKFDYPVSKMLDRRLHLLRDNATLTEGFT